MLRGQNTNRRIEQLDSFKIDTGRVHLHATQELIPLSSAGLVDSIKFPIGYFLRCIATGLCARNEADADPNKNGCGSAARRRLESEQGPKLVNET